MSFGFQKASCVVVGTFNMYILHPQWLAKHEIIEKGIEVAIAANFTQPGFRLTFPKNNVTWIIAPNRLVVESHVPTVDCGAFVASVLTALPETPLQAIGNNVHYEGELAELATLSDAIREFPRAESPSPDERVEQRTFHVGLKRTDHEFTNLQLSLREEKLELACNAHTAVGGRKDANAEAVGAARQFFDDRTRLKTLAQHFFGTAIDHDAHNA